MSAPTAGAACVLLSAALVSWPSPAAVCRTAACVVPTEPGAAPRRGRARRWARPPGWALVLGAAVPGAAVAGVGGALAALALAATVGRVRRALVAGHARTAATAGLADALGSFAAEARAGVPLAAAAESAAVDAHEVAAGAFARVAATARLGGDVPAALRGLADGPRDTVVGAHLTRLAEAWGLAERHGVALAGPVDAVAADLRARARLAGGLEARLAGPRATATVLAALPVLGIALGEGIGARPWSVLSSTALGQGLLVIGVGLVCAGVLWTARITERVAR